MLIKNKIEKQAHDVIHVTKCDNNFHKRIFFGNVHYGLSSGKKYHKGKIMSMSGSVLTKKLQL